MIAELRDIALFSIGGQSFCSFAMSAFVDHVHVLGLMTSAYSNALYTSKNLFKTLTLSSEIESQSITLKDRMWMLWILTVFHQDNVGKVNVGSINLLGESIIVKVRWPIAYS